MIQIEDGYQITESEVVQNNLKEIHEELTILRREELRLDAELTKVDLVHTQVNSLKPRLRKLLQNDTHLTIPIKELNTEIGYLFDELTNFDPKGIYEYVDEFRSEITAIIRSRQIADIENASDSLRQDSSESRQKQQLAINSLTEDEEADYLTALKKTKQMSSVSGLRFVFIPSGWYNVGPKDDDQQTDGSGDNLFNTPSKETFTDGYFISESPATSEDLHRLSLAGLYFPEYAEFYDEESDLIKSKPSNWIPKTVQTEDGNIRIERYEYHHRNKDDGSGVTAPEKQFCEVPYFLSKRIASKLGCEIPDWKHWEIATSGIERFKYPSSELNVKELFLEEINNETVIQSYGKYSKVVSPFGLKNLYRCGGEWNSVQGSETEGTLRKVFSDLEAGDPSGTHLIRTLSSLQMSEILPPGDANRLFNKSSPMLFQFGSPYRMLRNCSFRLLIPMRPPLKQPERGVFGTQDQSTLSFTELKQLIGTPAWSVISKLGRIEDRSVIQKNDPQIVSAAYYSKGLLIKSIDSVITSVTLFSGSTVLKDWNPSNHQLVDELTLSSIEEPFIDPDGDVRLVFEPNPRREVNHRQPKYISCEIIKI